jgi:hypothetical protein
MKFIAGLLVWANRGIRETPQVFPRLRGFANRRVDLHLPLIASIPQRTSGKQVGQAFEPDVSLERLTYLLASAWKG